MIGLVWYYTFRETRIYINLRRKYLISPDYANSVAARTVFVPSIPANINNIKDLEKIFNRFPGGVRRIWLNRYRMILVKTVVIYRTKIIKIGKWMTSLI